MFQFSQILVQNPGSNFNFVAGFSTLKDSKLTTPINVINNRTIQDGIIIEHFGVENDVNVMSFFFSIKKLLT